MSTTPVLYHGGVAGYWIGDLLTPNNAEHRYVDGCQHCAAQREGRFLVLDPPTPPDWVYATSDREYARFYASRAVRGSLYRVRLEGDVEPSIEDPFPTWRGRRAIILGVPEIRVTLTMRQRRKLWCRWGGTPEEFDQMIRNFYSTPTPRAESPTKSRETE